MEVSVPSQFLNVLLSEEQESRVTSFVSTSYMTSDMAKDDEKLPALMSTTSTLLPQPTSSSIGYSLERSMISNEKRNTIKKNGLSDERKQDLMKNFPKALLAECTVEIHNTLNRPEKLQQRLCFDAKVSPVFSKPAGFTSSTNRGIEISDSSNFKPASISQLQRNYDNRGTGGDVLELIEAVYSDHESENETELEDEEMKLNDFSVPPDIVIKQESSLSAVSLATVGGIPKFNFKCEHCPNVYPNRGALWQHSVATHSAEKTCECKICGRKFYRNCSLALHLKSHSEEEYCACKECGKSFTRLINLERHMKVHSDGEQLQCEHCDKTFSDRTNLLRHAVCHVSPTMKSHHCSICGKSYKSQDHLEIHYQSSHASISCSVCGQSFSSFGELMLHDAIHTGDHRYLCKYCNKSFSQKAMLKKHLIIHTGEQLKCNTCGIEFTQRSSLLRHVKRLHCSSGQINNNLMAQITFDPVTSRDTDDNHDIKSESIDVKEDDYVDFEDDIEEVDITESET